MSGKYKKVAYYPGCALEGTGHAYNRSTKEVGKALGLELTELKNWNCCGAMEVKNVDPKLQTYLSARNLVDRRGHGLRHRDGALQRLLSQSQEGRIRPRARSGLARGQCAHRRQGRPHDLRSRQGRDHPRARLDQGSDRRRGPEGAGEELAQGAQGRQLLRLHVHAPAPHLPGEGSGAGLGIDLASRISWTTCWRRPAPRTSNTR